MCQIECRYGRLHCTIMISGVDSVTKQEKSRKMDENSPRYDRIAISGVHAETDEEISDQPKRLYVARTCDGTCDHELMGIHLWKIIFRQKYCVSIGRYKNNACP